MTQPNKMHEQR